MDKKEFELTPDLFEKLPDDEKNAENISYESRTYLADAMIRFKKNKMAMAGLIFLIIMTLACIIVPFVSPFTYDGQNMSIANQMPSLTHLMLSTTAALLPFVPVPRQSP